MNRMVQLGLLALLALAGTVSSLSSPRLALAQMAPEPECGRYDSGDLRPDWDADPRDTCPKPGSFSAGVRLDGVPGSLVDPGSLDATDVLDAGARFLSTFPFTSSNNQGNAGGGVYFDLLNVGGAPIKIAYWDTNITTAGTFNVDIFYRAGTASGGETSVGTWTLMGNDPAVAGPGLNQPARVNVGGLVIKPGEQYGIALRCNNCANRYTNGTAGLFPPGNVFTNGELEIHAGTTNNIAFSSAPFNSRVWNGTVYYDFDLGGAQGVDPNRQLGSQVHLPILNFQGQDDVCRTMIEVQYIGCDPSKAVLVTWGEPGFCPPQAAGPLKVECTGLLFPGTSWIMMGAQIPTGSKGGMLFKFTAEQLTDVGIDLGFDDVVADLMCETLFFGVVGDADDYRRFKKAYNEGLDFAGINQRIAAGTGFLAVEVLRHCPGDVTPGVEVSSKYIGIAAAHLGQYDPVFGGHGYYVPLIYANKAGLNTVMYIQNGGLECSSLELWFKAQDDCLRARICDVATLAPGETYQFDASDCVGPDWQGAAWIRASEVMGVAVDIYGRDILMTYIGEPAPFDYTAIEDGDASPATGEKIAYGPLIYSEYQGWDTGVQVMNLSQVFNAKVKVYFLDRSGDVITTLVDWVCPRGSQTFFLPVVADLPGAWVGSIRVESQDWWTPGSNTVEAPDVVGVATLMKYGDVARTETQQAIAYNLLVEHKSYIWQTGAGAGGLFSGVGLIAIPSLLKDLDGSGVTSETAIMNLVAKPGFTDFAIYIFDQNGLLDFVCQKLHSRQVEYIDLQTWGYVNNGFKGSAVISATFWEHDVFDPDGKFVRNLVGLGAVMVERTGTRLGEDIPGDEAAGSRGIPFAAEEIGKDWCPGGFVPRCPGQPVYAAVEETFEALSAAVTAIPDSQLIPGLVQTVTVSGHPDDCLVIDVNVPLNITHTFAADLDVSLAHLGKSAILFDDICGSVDNVSVVLDDDAAANIQGNCATPVGQGLARKTESGSALNGFDRLAANGAWTLTVVDDALGDIGTLNSWGVQGVCRYRRLQP
ncbi:MAG TPA: hypothetical protein PK826_11895 [Anaerolineae bacterium]|nr:hypothetical protein [Anaerolineae bacterium]